MACAKKKSLIQKQIPTQNFEMTNIIFAKLNGFPEWPAQLHDIQKKQYTVVFFGKNHLSLVVEMAFDLE